MHKITIASKIYFALIFPSLWQERDRGVPAPKKLTLNERRAKVNDKALEAEARRFKLPYVSGDAVQEAAMDVEEFMNLKFKDYVPLTHHLPRYKETQYLALHSKETPHQDKNITMAYTGGAQSEKSLNERFKDCLRVTTSAKKYEDMDGVDDLLEEDAV